MDLDQSYMVLKLKRLSYLKPIG